MIPNPWIILGLLVAWLGSLTAVGVWQNRSGHAAEHAAWADKQTAELTAANAKILDLTETARAKESLHAVELNNIANDMEEKLKNVELDKDRFIAGVRNGTVRLRDPYPAAVSASADKASPAPAAASRCDGEARTELSGEASEFLYGEAGRADALANQLAACQAVILKDREMQAR